MDETKIDIVLVRLGSIEQRCERMEGKMDDHGEKLYEMHGEVSGLKVRTGLIAGISGLITAVLARVGFGH
jgi:hypothetical protein